MLANIRFEPAKNTILRWFTIAGPGVPAHIYPLLLGSLYNSPTAAVIATLSGFIENSFALALSGSMIFAGLLILETTVTAARYWISHRVVRAASLGSPIPTDLYLFATFLWCGLQGASIFACIMTGIVPIQILAAATAAALMSPICIRNYAAPRWALFLSAIAYLPFLAAGLIRQESWSFILVFQAPIYFAACLMVIEQMTKFAVATHLAHIESHHNSVHDSLTRLMNRAGLQEAMLQPPWQADPHFCVFYLDLDGFKSINDGFGHLAGDHLLRQVSARLMTAIRRTDILVRMGGDEFLVIAPGMTPDAADSGAASLIRHIVEPAISTEDGMIAFHFGVTAGYACAPQDGTSIEELISKADSALIATKRTNKGTYRRYSDGGTTLRKPEPDLSAAA